MPHLHLRCGLSEIRSSQCLTPEGHELISYPSERQQLNFKTASDS